MFETHEFGLDKAVHFAKLSAIAYGQPLTVRKEAKKLGYTKSHFFDKDGAQAYGFIGNGIVTLAFRGTEPNEFNDIKADLNARHSKGTLGCLVHRGFQCEVDDLWLQIEGWLEKNHNGEQIYTCGHSLGGAMSTIAASRLPEGTIVYNYGSPRVGSPGFAKVFNKKYKAYRFVNNNDIVPRVPFSFMWYKHIGQLHYINTYGKIRNATPWQRMKDRFRGYRAAWASGDYFDSASDHSMTEYVAKIEAVLNEKAG